MKVFTKVLKHILFSITIVLTGFLLFTFVLSFNVNNTLMSSKYHETLLAKNNVYSYVNDLISASINEFFKNLDTEEANTQNAELLKILKNTTSPEMVNMNINSITEQIFQYFRGERKNLPDLYIDINMPSGQNEYDQAHVNARNPDISEQIKKINLQSILLTLNRTDILEQLKLIKFVYFVASHITELSIFFSVLMLLIISIIYKKTDAIVKWLLLALLACGFFNLAFSVVLFIFLNKLLPNSIYFLTIAMPLNSELILSYIRDLLSPLSLFCFTLGIVFSIFSIMFYFHKAKLMGILKAIKVLVSKLPVKSKKMLKYGVTVLVLVFILFGMGYNLYAFKSGYDSNNFSSVVSKLTNANTVTQVISAKDETIYTLQVKLKDSVTDEPVPNIKVSVSGHSKTPQKYYNLSEITDEEGVAKFILGKGKFHLSFTSPVSDINYSLPAPFFYEIKSAGITILTVNLEKIKPADGIAEIEVLNEENNPVKNLELYLNEELEIEPEQDQKQDDDSSAFTDTETLKCYSVTNSKGIAVFKLPQGKYNVGFSKSKFPEEYIIPENFEINIYSDYVTRYTIRIENKTEESDPESAED
ncbi:hypothetical protein [Acetivibrio clariflavus]|uniref:hypothetical protein n=1 Tax=Acetivibrio clariflavus TaxID=288965 RepID=UPI000489A5E5|nr:hypothetical protein [Acetivibrio clariflavus]